MIGQRKKIYPYKGKTVLLKDGTVLPSKGKVVEIDTFYMRRIKANEIYIKDTVKKKKEKIDE